MLKFKLNIDTRLIGVSSAAEYDQNGICKHGLHFLNTIKRHV